RVSTLTPQALASAGLLAWRGRGIPANELRNRIQFLRELAASDGARVSATLEGASSDPTAPGPIGNAVRSFVEDGLLIHEIVRGESIYVPIDERRIQLSYSKNTAMNWIAPRSLVASAVLAHGARGEMARIREGALFLSRLFKLEFIYRVDATFEAIFAETVDALERHGLLARSDDEVIAAAPDHRARGGLEFLADLLRDFLESYLIVAITLEELARHGPVDRRTLVRTALEVGRAEFLAGRVSAMEAISRFNLENAVAWFLDRGVLIERDRKLGLGPQSSGAAAPGAVAAELRRYLR
ncbi:MAG TPA: glycerol-3-phosphate acyltransferase, partial [Myxococcaceae bacterium]|nr:glycerol-3-phosphate acyltransferase [Myxococcaceae bacterium]